jgi:outer membrane protein OmpA-like peptidoglycan-associated protein
MPSRALLSLLILLSAANFLEAQNPVRIYLACRNDKVVSQAKPDAPEDLQAVRNLCGLTLPQKFHAYIPVVVQKWVQEPTLLPSAALIDRYAQETLAQRNRLTPGVLAIADSTFDPIALFTPNSANLTEDATRRIRAMADTIAASLEKLPDIRIVVKGWADSSGSDIVNQQLADQRAAAVRRILVDAKIPLSRIVTTSEVVTTAIPTALDRDARRAATISTAIPTTLSTSIVRMPAASAPEKATVGGRPLAAIAAQVLVEHAANEVARYLLTTSGRNLCSTTRNGLVYSEVLTRTCRLFNTEFNGLYSPGLLSVIEAVRTDLQQLPLYVLTEALASEPLAKNVPAAAALAREAVGIVKRLESGIDPAFVVRETLTVLEKEGHLGAGNNIQSHLIELGRMLDYLAIAEATIQNIDLKAAVTRDTLLVYALRTVAVQNVMGTDVQRRVPLNANANAVNAFLTLADDVEKLREAVNLLRAATSDTAEVSRQALQFTQLAIGFASQWFAVVSTDVPQYATIVEPTVHILGLVRAREYTTAAGELANLFINLHDEWCPLEPVEGGKPRRAACPSYEASVQSYRLLRLVADVANATSDRDASLAFQSFLGTARDPITKRASDPKVRVTLNAYVGAGGGFETDSIGTGTQAGLRIPIGLELHYPTDGWSVGLFGSLIDLGNVTTVSFKDGVKSEPNVEFAALFNPGLFLSLGIKDTPFSVLAGWSYTAAARETNAGATLNVHRWSIVGAVDIPLLP